MRRRGSNRRGGGSKCENRSPFRFRFVVRSPNRIKPISPQLLVMRPPPLSLPSPEATANKRQNKLQLGWMVGWSILAADFLLYRALIDKFTFPVFPSLRAAATVSQIRTGKLAVPEEGKETPPLITLYCPTRVTVRPTVGGVGGKSSFRHHSVFLFRCKGSKSD